MARFRSLSQRRLRRSMSNINVVPYIDVMLVLLVIFMVAAPMISPSLIHLPSVSQAQAQQTAIPLIVNIHANQEISLKYKNPDGQMLEQTMSLSALRSFILNRQLTQPDEPVVIAADKTIAYQNVMDIMSSLKEIGVKRIGLLVLPS